jgi:NAD(P)-dependent dehydrogenase (short-subunit alcohol dehydrogenase family)
MLLKDKNILVTGAGSGIGRGAALFFASQGARLFLSDLDSTTLEHISSEIPGSCSLAGDVTDEDYADRLIDEAASRGRLNGVFHCAGISDKVLPALELQADDWQRIIDVNVRGTFLIARSAGRVMVEQRSGSIVTTSSVNGVTGIPRRHAYGPSKAAVAQLTRTLACEWGQFGVRVNALAPTYVATPMIERLASEGKVDIGRLERRTPLGRIASVDDVARAASYLLSDWSDYVTGIVLPIDGGWTAYGGPGDVSDA